MFQCDVIIERGRVGTSGSRECAFFGETNVAESFSGADRDDDALLDSWLGSLDPREFEVILNRLASMPSGLEASA
jgi:hypothetical protein